MAVPPLHDFMLPFLQRIADGSEHRLTELIEFLVKEFALTEDGLKKVLPSGRETRFKNRVSRPLGNTWAGSRGRSCRSGRLRSFDRIWLKQSMDVPWSND